MLAVFYRKQGPAQEVMQYGEQPLPEPAAGEVRVRLHTSGVNPSDWKVRKGGFGRSLIAPLIIPHSDGAGAIDAVGEGVPATRIGERVWTWNGQWKRPFGTAAQCIALPSFQAVPLPPHLGYPEGACLGIPAMTAMHAVRLAEAQEGMNILVVGGAGAVAHYAIQLAKARGARVLTTVSSAAKEKLAHDAGADHVINYRTEDVASRLKALTGGAGVDAIIEMDFSANAKTYPQILKPRSNVIVYGMSGSEATLSSLWLMQNSIALKFFLIYEITRQQREAALGELMGLLRNAGLKHAIGSRLPLREAAIAHDLIEQGSVVGNVVLDVP
jgi:NADPH2:quinone reductase